MNAKQARAALARSLDAGLEHHRAGRLREAKRIYQRVLQSAPMHPVALHLLGIIAHQSGSFESALEFFDKALLSKPDFAEALSNRGNALHQLKRHAEALASCDRALALDSEFADAWNNRGNALKELKRYEEALAAYGRALALKPAMAEALYNRGTALHELNRYEQALASYDEALALNPGLAEAWNNRGDALKELKRYSDALAAYDQALALRPDMAEALYNRGIALQALDRFELAIASFERAIADRPEHPFLHGMLLHTQMRICDWKDFAHRASALAASIARGEPASAPFAVLALDGSPPLQKMAAEIWVKHKYPADHSLGAIPKHARASKIRVGYFSADFRNHAVCRLMAELFESHDRTKFETYAFSLGPDSTDELRQRVAAAFDQFIDVRAQSDREVALLARKLEIDIAVDLGGFTTDSRTGILALRAAPLQVSYIGYLGTMGAEYMDYLIADRTIIPHGYLQHYAEKIIYLPSYQANDSKRRIADKRFARAELGLPQASFVFCCLNNSYKITPATFDGWMRILKQVAGSVLWLYEDNALAVANLRKEAEKRGIDARRLIFAKTLPAPEYLARYRAADLYLDTLPYNAGTTASDALWAGLPLLTCAGEAFASRMAASLLRAIHLPELITSTQEQYEALAVELATDAMKMAQIRLKLAHHRLTTPLFDTQRFTRHLEAAYREMYERYLAGLPPAHLYIA